MKIIINFTFVKKKGSPTPMPECPHLRLQVHYWALGKERYVETLKKEEKALQGLKTFIPISYPYRLHA